MVNNEKVRQKIQFIRNEQKKLQRFQAMEFKEFASDDIYQDAAIRVLQVMIECVLDICAHVIAREGLGIPKTYVETVKIAVQNDLISPDKEQNFISMAKFRNRVVHMYDEVDKNEVFNILQNNTEDFNSFIKNVVNYYYK